MKNENLRKKRERKNYKRKQERERISKFITGNKPTGCYSYSMIEKYLKDKR